MCTYGLKSENIKKIVILEKNLKILREGEERGTKFKILEGKGKGKKFKFFGGEGKGKKIFFSFVTLITCTLYKIKQVNQNFETFYL